MFIFQNVQYLKKYKSRIRKLFVNKILNANKLQLKI